MASGTRGRLAPIAESTEDPPACADRVWWRRQRKIRALICRHLAKAAATPSVGLAASEIRSRLAHHEPEEIVHAIRRLEEEGVIEQSIRTVARGRGAPEPELYWRLAGDMTDGSSDEHRMV